MNDKHTDSSRVEFSADERNVLAYLATKRRVDVRWLSEEDKLIIRNVLDELHNRKRLSLLRISKEVGKSYGKVWGLCRALELSTRNVAEADRNSAEERSKHKKTPFDRTEEEKAYILGFSAGDLTVQQVSSLALFVSSTTTHPAFAKLFRELFENYGPVYQYPMYEANKGYRWKLAARVDNSFSFLLKQPREALRLTTSKRPLFLNWLAGLMDSDGNINITNGSGYVRAMLAIYNQDRALLNSTKRILLVMGYHPVGPYLGYVKGTVTPYARYTKDMWRLQLERIQEVQNLLTELPLRHSEKIRRKALLLRLSRPAKWNHFKARVLKMRRQIRNEVMRFLEQAEQRYLSRHTAERRKDRK